MVVFDSVFWIRKPIFWKVFPGTDIFIYIIHIARSALRHSTAWPLISSKWDCDPTLAVLRAEIVQVERHEIIFLSWQCRNITLSKCGLWRWSKSHVSVFRFQGLIFQGLTFQILTTLKPMKPAHIQSKLQELHATKWFSETCDSIVDMFLPRRKSERAWNHEVPVGSVGSVGFAVLARCCRCLAFGAELCCEAPHFTTLQRTAMTRRSWVCGSQSHAKTVFNMSEGSVVHYFCACSSAEIVLTQVYSGTGWLDRVFASANSRGLPSNSIWTHLNRFQFSRI